MYLETHLTEPWQWLYLAIIAIATLPLITAIVTEHMAHGYRPPLWIATLAVLGMLIEFTPYGWGLLFYLNLMLLGSAPLATTLFAVGFSLFAWYAALRAIIPFAFERVR